jgi:hypothetical protein
LLLDRLRASAPARVVTVSSAAHRRASRGLPFDDLQTERHPYRGFRVYGESKLANILFTRELARRLTAEGARVTANACHPGLVATRFGLDGDTHGLLNALGRPFVRRIGLSPALGAATQIWLASSPEVAERTGGYFVNGKESRPSPAARDDEAARKGDPVAIEAFDILERRIGEGLASLSAVLDPDVIVIGGGVSESHDLSLEQVRHSFTSHVSGGVYRPAPDLRRGTLLNSAGMIGVAALARI